MGGSSSSKMNSPVVIAAKARQTATVIFLHGLGDTGHGWAAAFSSIQLPFVKYICPTAPVQPVTLNGGMRMNAWFDIMSLEAGCAEDEPGIKKATETVHQLIEEEVNSGIPSERIILGGFSQGGALALHSALHYPRPLGGVLAFSCWLPLHQNYITSTQAGGGGGPPVYNKSMPVLQCHGDSDPLIPQKWGLMTSTILSSFMPKATFKTYPGLAHSSCREEMDDAKDFINNIFNSEGGQGGGRAGN